jgi:hypothetical protein
MMRVRAILAVLLLFAPWLCAPGARAYVLDRTIANTNDPRNAGISACPMLNRLNAANAGGIDRRWDTALGANVFTSPGFPGGATAEVESAIQESLGVWTNVSGSALSPGLLGPLTRVSGQTSCVSGDGLNTICFAQPAAFSSGVLAFTQVLAADTIGEQAGGKTATFIGEILDADILFNPAISLATPGALGANPGAYDLESLLIHELGHSLGFSHSGVLRAVMFPFAPPAGTFLGDRPSSNQPDAPLADDDRAGLRVLYPGSQTFGSISGRILPVNPLSLGGLMATSPGLAVTGYFGTHVVAVDADSGEVVAATLGGFACDPSRQLSVFDGSYEIAGLPLGRRYSVYVEPLDGVLPPGEISGPLLTQPCRRGTTNSCNIPPLNTNFTTKVRP